MHYIAFYNRIAILIGVHNVIYYGHAWYHLEHLSCCKICWVGCKYMTHFILIDCPDPMYNSSTTDLDTSTRKQYYFSGENITYKCKSNHSLVSGNLNRTCLGNGSWSGKQPVCRSEKELCSKRLINMIFIYEKKSNKSASSNVLSTEIFKKHVWGILVFLLLDPLILNIEIILCP